MVGRVVFFQWMTTHALEITETAKVHVLNEYFICDLHDSDK